MAQLRPVRFLLQRQTLIMEIGKVIDPSESMKYNNLRSFEKSHHMERVYKRIESMQVQADP